MTALEYLRLWTGGFVRVEIATEGVPTSYKFRGELLNDADEPKDLSGWFVIIRTADMRVPGVGSLELRLDGYEHHKARESANEKPTVLVFSVAQRVTLTVEPVVEDPG